MSVVLNLTDSEAEDLRHLLDKTDGDILEASESGTKKKINIEILKQTSDNGVNAER